MSETRGDSLLPVAALSLDDESGLAVEPVPGDGTLLGALADFQGFELAGAAAAEMNPPSSLGDGLLGPLVEHEALSASHVYLTPRDGLALAASLAGGSGVTVLTDGDEWRQAYGFYAHTETGTTALGNDWNAWWSAVEELSKGALIQMVAVRDAGIPFVVVHDGKRAIAICGHGAVRVPLGANFPFRREVEMNFSALFSPSAEH